MIAKRPRRRLIINADGYGFTPGVNRGIELTFEAGIVRSTSCTPNFGFLGEVGQVARRFFGVSFGIHFNLSVGRPLTSTAKVSSLVDESGEFYGTSLLDRLLSGKIRYAEMITELTAQAATLSDAGVPISHFDGHQNKHLYPRYFEACMEVAHRFNIRGIRTHRRMLYVENGPISARAAARFYASHPARIFTHVGGRLRARQANRNGFLTADRLITPGYADASHKTLASFWSTLARTLPEGTSEVYCHPGIPDDILRANAKYVDERKAELDVLTDPSLAAEYDLAGVDLISFHELSTRAK